MSKYIIRAKCKAYLLDPVNQRAYKMPRVASSVFEDLDRIVQAAMDRTLAAQPSKGKTIR